MINILGIEKSDCGAFTISEYVRRKATSVRLVVTDVDGVLTDKRISISVNEGGDRIETYTFNVLDGMGVKELERHDIPVCFISGRKSPAVFCRARDLDVSHILLGVEDKVGDIEGILKIIYSGWEEVLFIGDDIQDLSLLRMAGLPVAPADASPEVLEEVRVLRGYVSPLNGGDGVFRDVAELVLKSQGYWNNIISRKRTLG